ncbi:MAG TPA: cation:proton antiporter, partial [Thermoanaerobaculia bacterium]|nr:cation:proton antiporter [Thermoanaerobaculia bacterium]
MPDLLTVLALAAFVLVFAGLSEGFVARAPLSFPILFLGLGYWLGSRGVIPNDLHHSPILEAVAVVTLALVLFLDAVRMKFDRAPSEWLVPSLVLGPGTLLCVILVATAAHFLFGTGLLLSILLGAILSSTDPVVLRDIVRDKRVPSAIRQALTTEAATNDVVVLPIVLIVIAVAQAKASTAGGWAIFLARLLVLGPAIGFAIGAFGAWLMSWMDKRFGIRREYQSLYGMGLVFASYSGAVAVGGDGFLASFAAGAAIAALDLELCDCFLEYGDATSEMIMLFAFILFGAVLSTLVGTVPLAATLAFAAITLFVARPAAIAIVLRRAELSHAARAFIAWFGPRGLASLLLALLAVESGIPGADMILALAGVVVTVSVILHGMTATPLTAVYTRRVSAETLAEERVSTAADLLRGEEVKKDGSPLIEAPELVKRLSGPDPPLVLDVRSRSSFEKDPEGIPGGVRVPPDEVE